MAKLPPNLDWLEYAAEHEGVQIRNAGVEYTVRVERRVEPSELSAREIIRGVMDD